MPTQRMMRRTWRPVFPRPPGGFSWLLAAVGAIFWLAWAGPVTAARLTTLEFHLVGAQLQASPAALSVPKGLPGSFLVQLSGEAQSLAVGAHVEALLRGPSFPARRIVGEINQPILLPPLPLVGDYRLDNVRLVDTANGQTRLEAAPSSIPVTVFDEVLISRVTSRPLTYEEIREKGIVIDEHNFRAVEFEVGFVLDGATIPVKFPVIAPKYADNTEVVPAAELEDRLRQAQALNDQIAAELPWPAQLPHLNIEIKGLNLQRVDDKDVDLRLQIPPIPALMVIPGNIGYLNQFFSVMIFTENGAPGGSGLSVHSLQAELILPNGPDQIPGSYDLPGDDPLRFARTGPDAVMTNVRPVVQPGADGTPGTADDNGRLQPGESGQAEFLVEGLQEGLHVMDLKLRASLDGLVAGTVAIEGRAAGSVLVRNPKFSMAFCHPRTIRAGEPYEAQVTILNTGQSAANLVSVNLTAASLSGGVLESPESVELGTILPGETKTATYRIRAQRTGSISFSNLTTSDDSLVGRFRLKMGIDERGVALSPDTIALPSHTEELPAGLLSAAQRVLGQALGTATAAILPPGVKPVNRSIITTRAIELAEAGQRLRYGDELNRTLLDLLLDWQGGRSFESGFDQILRQTDAGREFRAALTEAIFGEPAGWMPWLSDHLPDLAGRGEGWTLATASTSSMAISCLDVAGTQADAASSNIVRTLIWSRQDSDLAVAPRSAPLLVQWRTLEAIPGATLTAWLIDGEGQVVEWTWNVGETPAGATFLFDPALSNGVLLTSHGGASSGSPRLSIPPEAGRNTPGASTNNGLPSLLPGLSRTIDELPPEALMVWQDTEVSNGRPWPTCLHLPFENYATILAVLFSKPMAAQQVEIDGAFVLDNGVSNNYARLQPGGRVVLLNMRAPLGAIIPRTLSFVGLTDPRGHPLVQASSPVFSEATQGIAARGQVIRADGTPVAGIPVTLTMYDQYANEADDSCEPQNHRPAQVMTDAEGRFAFDFIIAGMPFSLSATDTSGLSSEAGAAILEAISGELADRQKLLELANDPAFRDTLLGVFAAGSITDVVAQAEGVDRALYRDMVPLDSTRLGTEQIVGLRFRGRGAVAGQVLLSDGLTPAASAVVNLFPDPASRELGRGLVCDNEGRFAFLGVPLGAYTIEATGTNGATRLVSGLLDQPGVSVWESILLADGPPGVALTGRVIEAATGLPHPNAVIYVGKFTHDGEFVSIQAVVTADGDGFWSAGGISQETHDLLFFSADNRRRGERRGVTVLAGANPLLLELPGFATVRGRVEFSNGQPAPNALVAGGEVLVRTDANGFFTLTGVPIGPRTISAGLEYNPAAGIDFTRLGSCGLQVLPGDTNWALVRFPPKGRVIGSVVDAQGQPVGGINVAMPVFGGFYWAKVDANGFFAFNGLDLGENTFSAPAPPVEDKDVSQDLAVLRTSASEEEILAAITHAFAVFTGQNDPFLNGDGDTFNPPTWGFTKTNLSFDGQTQAIIIRYLPQSTISGVVQNGQGFPIGARVRLTGLGPSLTGAPITVLRGERDSDPATGVFIFEKQALLGDWGLQAASPFYPVVISTAGRTWPEAPDATGLVLQFPATREVNGRLAGTVYYPDGTPVGAGVSVAISFSDDYVIRTDEAGRFDTQIALPALDPNGQPGRGYTLRAEDPVSGLRGMSLVTLLPGVLNEASVHLLPLGHLTVTILQGGGQPAADANLTIRGGAYPNETRAGQADAHGFLEFFNLPAGPYGVQASFTSGAATLKTAGSATIAGGQTANLTLTLAGSGEIRGRFLDGDGQTPIAFAAIRLGAAAYTTTGPDGLFSVAGLPLGNYEIVAEDAVTGRIGRANASLTRPDEIRDLLITAEVPGTVEGVLFDSYGTGRVAGARITVQPASPGSPSRTVSTGPDGRYSFAGLPPGHLTLSAVDPVSNLRGQTSAILPAGTEVLTVNFSLQAMAELTGQVLQVDGLTPAHPALVTLDDAGLLRTCDTDPNGRYFFPLVNLGEPVLTASSRLPGRVNDVAWQSLTIGAAGTVEAPPLVLRGLGNVTGTVSFSHNQLPAAAATVQLTYTNPVADATLATVTDAGGTFAFSTIPTGPFQISVIHGTLGATGSGTLAGEGSSTHLDLLLSPSGTVRFRLVRADGITPVPGLDVALIAQAGGQLGQRTSADGTITLTSVPLGAFRLEAAALQFNGILYRQASLDTDGQELDLGDLPLDEQYPFVETIHPADGALDVPTTTLIDLLFNEPLRPDRIDPRGLYLSLDGQTVPAAVALLDNPEDGLARLVRITPEAPLLSQKTYRVIAIDGERRDALGGITALGVLDLANRPMILPSLTAFTTRDSQPPVRLSFTPENGAVQIDPRAVIRLSFDEPIATGAVMEMSGPGGPVAGDIAYGLNNKVLVFTPTTFLLPNTRYTATVSGIEDLSGNAAVGQPWTTQFDTIDTLGPELAGLSVQGHPTLLSGATVTLAATLAIPEPQVRIRFTLGTTPLGTTEADVLTMPCQLPQPGTVTARAIAIDRYGNEGPVAELPLLVVPNQPPTVQITQRLPAVGTVGSGHNFEVQITATDDGSVAETRAAAIGAATVPLQTVAGGSLLLAGTVPATALPGAEIRLFASATDNSGATSPDAVLTLGVHDATPPTLALAAPLAGSLLEVDAPLDLDIAWSDNSGFVQLEARLAAPGVPEVWADTEASAPPNQTALTRLTLPLDSLPTAGDFCQLTLTATDAAGLPTVLTRSFRLPDFQPPRLVSLLPAHQTANQSYWSTGWTILLDEALDPATLTADTVQVFPPSGPALERSIAILDVPTPGLHIQPHWPLLPNAVYRLLLKPGLADLAGNGLLDPNGLDLPPEGLASEFSTATFTIEQPLPDTPVIPGQSIAWRISYGPGGGAETISGSLGALPPTSGPALPEGGQLAGSLLLPVDATAAVLDFHAHATDRPTAPLGSVTLTVRARNGDEDGDGLPNGWEVDNGTDPWTDDASLDPDLDGLSHLQEFAAGTHPFRPDTDLDGLQDGAEITAGTDPLDPDTDGDNIPDGADPFPLLPNRPPVAVADTFTCTTGGSLSLHLRNDLLANDSDPENEVLNAAGATVAWVSHTPATHGALSLGGSDPDRYLQYFPEAGFQGTDGFDYVIADKHGLTATTHVTIQVVEPPVGVDDHFRTFADTPVLLEGILDNDTPPGQPYTIFLIGPPMFGALQDLGNSTYRYTPESGFSGLDMFEYAPVLGTMMGRNARVFIEVLPANACVWNNPAGGNWEIAANWLGNRVPVDGDPVYIDLAGTYTVLIANTTANSGQISLGRSDTTLGLQTLRIRTPGRLFANGWSNADASGIIHLESGTLSMGGDFHTVVMEDGDFRPGNSTIAGRFDWSAGKIQAVGNDLVLGYSSQSTWSGTGAKNLYTRVVNYGRIEYTGNGLAMRAFSDAAPESEHGRVTNHGTFVIDGPGGFTAVPITGKFVNNGTLIKRGTGQTSTFADSVVLTNTGSLEIESGVLEAKPSAGQWIFKGGELKNATTLTLPSGSALRGTGVIRAPLLINNGLLAPDPAPGGLDIIGNTEGNASARTEIHLGPRDPALEYRSVRITGSAVINNAVLAILVDPGFTEPVGSKFKITSYVGGSGQWHHLEGLTQAGYTFTYSFDFNYAYLTVTQAPTPSPRMAAFPVLYPRGNDSLPETTGAVTPHPVTDPATPATLAARLTIVQDPNGQPHLALIYRRPVTADSSRYEVQLSDDGRTWRSNAGGPTVTALFEMRLDPSDPDWLIITEGDLQPTSATRLLRLIVNP